ncbi:MAG: YccF domain-containing protein [Anaerolineae bacterium]|jgi:uncharacterized membrane protein YccF (DUF307 family)
MTTIVNINQSKKQPGCLGQLFWFLFIGWWASAIAVSLAYFCMLTIVGIPLGIAIINKLPKIIANREPQSAQGGVTVVATAQATVVNVGGGQTQQQSFVIRAVYFLLIGWWLGGLWMSLAWVICCTVIGLPLGLPMFDKAPAIMSLHRD